MNTLLKLASTLAHHLSKEERQSVAYLKVLAHKVGATHLKAHLQASLPHCWEAIEQLRSLRNELPSGSEGNTAGIKGVMSDGLERIENCSSPAAKDGLILQTAILLARHKLGNYQLLLHYLQLLEKEYAAYVVRTLVTHAESSLRRLIQLLDVSLLPTNETSFPTTSTIRSADLATL